MYGDTGVAVAAGVDDDAVGSETYLVYAVDYLAFDVALVVADGYVGVMLAHFVEHRLHCYGTVDLGLATAGEVEIGSVDDFDMFHNKITSTAIIYCIKKGRP